MNYAVILSGGIGTRMHMGDFPKQYYKVKGRMILEYTLDSFEKAQAVDEIVIVMAPQWQEELGEELRGKYKKLAGFALPGEIRQESILSGIEVCMKRSQSEKDKVIIHDGVRPLVSCELIEACFAAIGEYEACLPVIPATDTIYYSEDGTGCLTAPNSLWDSLRRPSGCISITRRTRGRPGSFCRVCGERRKSPMWRA